ncbi:glycosyltransferase family 4 protein [Flavobacterium capsici]|uniref:Glycosyltransferase family 1 protein n=1 Tax=Flavobacterium capsici TaxID=3075618 RepID=A0AA96J781_9FLAO|nr:MULTISPECIES: glycosyltransferase family 1 protein [unclassified Flavobacterium]WNM19672.1 glycosyltransferase family 1 protein [Flavobacterium sp. PMR2A8]WNM21061.1 glycosyltransferase family 1 protein [Flavobacterium sp. PMTSA4]
MKTKKIFIDCHVFDYGFQGTRTYIQGLYLELIKNKEIEFYFAATDINNLKSVFGDSENIHYVEYKSKNKFYRLLIDIPLLIKKNNIDFAHFQYIVPPFKKCKYINSIHDVLFIDFPEHFPKLSSIKNEFLYKYSAKKSEIILTGSQYSKNRIETHFKINNVFTTVYGVESVFYDSYDKKEVQEKVKTKYGYENIIIYVSRHEPRKNHYRLLKAFIDLKLYENHHLLLIGDITFRDEKFDNLLEESSKEIKEKIILKKKVAYNEMLQFLRASVLAVYPSFAEGFGLPPLETIAAKVPTLCSNATSMSEFDFFGEDFINPADFEEIKRKISYKLSNINEKRQEELSILVEKKYNWNEAAHSFIDIINKESIKN